MMCEFKKKKERKKEKERKRGVGGEQSKRKEETETIKPHRHHLPPVVLQIKQLLNLINSCLL